MYVCGCVVVIIFRNRLDSNPWIRLYYSSVITFKIHDMRTSLRQFGFQCVAV